MFHYLWESGIELIMDMIGPPSLFILLISGGVMICWSVVIGLPLLIMTPQKVKDYRFGEKSSGEIESHLALGWDLAGIILRFSLMANVAFPFIGRKRGLTQIRDVCPKWFIRSCVVFCTINYCLAFICLVSGVIMVTYSYFYL